MVATVTSIGSASSTVHYFEQDGYYAKGAPEHRKASFWHGAAAKMLRLGRHVSPKRFNAVLLGHVPGTDIRLGRMRDGEHQNRPGLDITLSAPKSVSLAALLHGDRRVIRAHDEAVRAALDRVEAELLQTRGWDPATRRRPRVKAHGMAAATFRHLASRNLDPQLHTHCVVANMTRNGAGAWRSIEATATRSCAISTMPGVRPCTRRRARPATMSSRCWSRATACPWTGRDSMSGSAGRATARWC